MISILYLEGTLTDLAGTLAAVGTLITYIKAEAEVDKSK